MSTANTNNSSAPVINQKEYLKKYLNIGTDKDKKKKKKKKITQNRVKIIDDNIDVVNSEILTVNELDEFLTQEDAPQVVGVIDDRPLALRVDDYRKSGKWKVVGSDDESKNFNSVASGNNKNSLQKLKNKDYDSDASPVRRKKYNSDSDASPVRRKQYNSDSDASPVRRKKYNSDSDGSLSRGKKLYDSDASPPRKRSQNSEGHISRHNRTDDSIKKNDRKRFHSDSDESSSRKNKKSDISSQRYFSKKDSNIDESDLSPPRKRNANKSDSDTSPPRKDKNYDKHSKRYDTDKPNKQDSSHNRPSREKYRPASDNNRYNAGHRKKSRWDASPPESNYSKQNQKKRDLDTDLSPPRTTENESKYSKHHDKHKYDKSKYSEPSTSKKMEKTLDGKTAGLQNARDLKHETQAFKKREDELFKKMSEEVSGMNAVPIIRDRKTGKKRDFEQEAMEEFKKMKKEREQKEKYDKWGKGLKQIEDMREKIESDLHEMNKPLARYADDEDLERYLKEQERDGDPMLEYIRKKKKKKAVDEGKPTKPVYEGEFMPNRFGVPPGHRWDGVDRSNGYENRWFTKENAKKAVEEEIYKWSTEDM